MRFMKLIALAALCLLAFSTQALAAKKLTVGATLHSYYSWVANIAGDTVNLVSIIPSGVDPHSYQPRPQELENLAKVDVVVENTLGHDTYIEGMLAAIGRQDIPRIKPNTGIALIPSAHKKFKFEQNGKEKVSYNSHSYISLLGATQQINTIATELGKLLPENAELYKKNARHYNKRLRNILRRGLRQLKGATVSGLSVATVHDGYAYLFRELGLTINTVVQPRHGIEPSARQLADTIKRIKRAKVNVLFTEVDYQKKYVDAIYQETHCRLYPLSHVSNGSYTAEDFELAMQDNVDTIVKALTTPAAQP